jgi:hypothetical protein
LWRADFFRIVIVVLLVLGFMLRYFITKFLLQNSPSPIFRLSFASMKYLSELVKRRFSNGCFNFREKRLYFEHLFICVIFLF